MLWFKKTNEIDSIRFPGAKVRICSETILKVRFDSICQLVIFFQAVNYTM